MAKRKNSTDIKLLLKYLKPRAGLFVAAFVCAVFYVGGTVSAPIIIGKAVDCIVSPGNVNFSQIAVYICILAALIVTALVFQWLMNVCALRAANAAVADVRRDGFGALSDAPLSYIDGHGHGDLTARVAVDADQIADGIVQGATHIFSGAVTIVATLVLMLLINWKIALVIVALTPLSLLVSYFVAHGSHKYFTRQSAVRGELYQKSEETVKNRAVVAAYGYADRAQADFDESNERLKDCGFKATFFSSLVNPCTRLINALVYAVAAVMGTLFVIDGEMSVGDLTVLLLYANQFARPLNEITSVITEFQTALAASARILEVTAVPPQDDDGKVMPLTGNVKLDNMSFGYEQNKLVLDGLDLDVKEGTTVAIVGRTGCGKTTLINLLMRFYDPQSGRILFDGEDSSGIKRSCVREAFGMVLQDSWIFKGTVRDNIAYGLPSATQEQVEEAAKKAHIHGFISRMPNGYDTVIDDSEGISQGQKQLINIARIMLCDPPMIILDEATSSIDTRTERRVQQAFDKLMRPTDGKKRTGFVVAHRLSTIKNADVILVMDKGRIIERGTHAELLEKGGAYAELYYSQFAGASS